MIHVTHLIKKYEEFTAVNNISFDVTARSLHPTVMVGLQHFGFPKVLFSKIRYQYFY